MKFQLLLSLLPSASLALGFLSTLPQKRVTFSPQNAGHREPSKKHNYVPKLRFILATVVYGSKRRVPSGTNPLHN
ncbi:hypothetical protein H5410_016855 [Solanum commersonii]|uniref:Uncharacterized protein n=1 Tax=Solanum commersonii TaxID=4109 RepID=A0A9J5ZYW2_SOLCO|nr:hypothetical protein H5410_016855 [Solanum commersonii]